MPVNEISFLIVGAAFYFSLWRVSAVKYTLFGNQLISLISDEDTR